MRKILSPLKRDGGISRPIYEFPQIDECSPAHQNHAGIFFLRFRSMSDNCKVDIVMRDGDEIELGNIAEDNRNSRPFQGVRSIFLEKEKILFCGDTIIEHITPNAFVMLDEHKRLPVRMSQTEFYESLARIRKLSPVMIYSAHGKAVSDIDKIIDGYEKAFAERQEKIMSIIKSERKIYTG